MVTAVLVGLAIFYVVSGLDDLFIDLVAWFKRLGPKKLDEVELTALRGREEKRIAILVPAWREAGVIGRMLSGNLRQLQYSNYHFFVGVYCNDPDTIKEVEGIAKAHANVHAVVNYTPGPTSKGQVLNEVVRSIFLRELETGERFDIFMLHDSEDVIHPKSLMLVNEETDRSDFVQLPVFSFPLPKSQLVAGTYADEFAESHTKDLLVRSYLGGGVPSAGVGTALSRKLVQAVRATNAGCLLNEGALTEDYELGMRACRAGVPAVFKCCFIADAAGKQDYIATREFFPRRFSAAVRQKTRWTIGISLQGWRNLGWEGTFVQRYFLVRDRKSVFANPLTVFGYGMATYLGNTVQYLSESGRWLFFMTLCLMVNRVFQRGFAAHRLYGLGHAMLTLVRVPVANLVNAAAGLRALKVDFVAQIRQGKIAWAKTDHELPAAFGS